MIPPLALTQEGNNTLDLNPKEALGKLDAWLDGAVRLLPNLVVAAIVFLLFIAAAWLAARTVRRSAVSRGRGNLGEVLGGFLKWAILVVGFLIAATIVFPALNPGDLIAGLGVSSVAIGFAFKDILQNWLAGLLILLRQPFAVGDQISVNGFEGAVERVETRATILKTYDGQAVVIPNSDIYTNAVVVKTAHDLLRSEYDVGIGYGDGLEDACFALSSAVSGTRGVDKERGVEALPWDLAASWVTVRVRWWTKSDRASVVTARGRVIAAIKAAMDEEGIDMPFETYVQLLHDQTEASDGDRALQREGWPTGERGSTPRWRARLEEPAKGGE